MPSTSRSTITIPVGAHTVTFETGHIARQAHGSVVVRCGDTIVLGTACRSADPLPDIDFLPLRIDYQEKFASVGKTPAGFIKREGKPTQAEILVCRLIDRPLRPMFEDGYFHDTQVLATVFSYDGQNAPDMLGILAASAALCLSDIPLIKPIAAVRVGLVQNQFVVNPTVSQQKQSLLDLVLAGTEDAILMVEGKADFLTEEQMLEAIEAGQAAIRTICQALDQWRATHGKPKHLSSIRPLSKELLALLEASMKPALAAALHLHEKSAREQTIGALRRKALETYTPATASTPYPKADVLRAFDHLASQCMRQMVLDEQVRCDGRDLVTIRPIHIEQALLPRTHGSSLFTRGETQTLAVCVLGSEDMAQRYEDLEGESSYRFYLQYFFPPYSVGEVGRMGAPGRREIGHGKLAERALQGILPSLDQFPYTIRLESNITESNGSSSMASVCGGCLALMDAGVPIKRPVSGIAMGLIVDGPRFAILSDILGTEDAYGDMDFKVTGDQQGITAFQMDVKVEGITIEIMRKALHQAKEGRIHILNIMLAACPASRTELSLYAPRIETIQIKPSKIGIVIGPGGKQIRAITEETGVELDVDDSGLISISSKSPEAVARARAIIEGLVAEAEIGKTYTGPITNIMAFGFFVEIIPGKEGLCHISEIDSQRIEDIFEYVKGRYKIGDEITVKVLDVNERGQIKLSRRALLQRHAPVDHHPASHAHAAGG